MLSEKLRNLRKDRGISCPQLAKMSNHNAATIYGIEAGRNRNPSFNMMCDIANALEVSTDYFNDDKLSHLKRRRQNDV